MFKKYLDDLMVPLKVETWHKHHFLEIDILYLQDESKVGCHIHTECFKNS